MDAKIRVANMSDMPAIHALIKLSAETLQREFYDPHVIEEALELVVGIEALVSDNTFFIAECKDELVACGGYQKYGGIGDVELKAFFVHPNHAHYKNRPLSINRRFR
ncbi:hypothetical protein ACFL2V_20300 [Pseudomonadota bacterium]